MADSEGRPEWLLPKSYNPYLIVLSIFISFLGAHATTQSPPQRRLSDVSRLMCQTYATSKVRAKVVWIALGSFMFGGWYSSIRML
jgi:hypothetical protein